MSGSVLASPSLPSPGNVELSGVRDGISRSASKKQIRTAGSIDPTPTSISSVTARHLSSSDHHSDDEHHGTPLVAGRRGSDALPLGSGSALSGRAGYDSAHGAVINVRLEDIVTLVRAQEVADPGALGLAGFALTTFALSVFNANLLPKTLEGVVLPLAAFYGGVVQLLAGMWEFKRGPAGTFGAVAFSSYGAFWMSFAGYVWVIAPTLPAADAHNATGLFLFSWWMFTLYMTAASLKTYGALVAVFAVLNCAFLLLVIGAFGTIPKATVAGGWCGIVCAGLAWYCSAAQILKATWGRIVLPIWPLNGVTPAPATTAGTKK